MSELAMPDRDSSKLELPKLELPKLELSDLELSDLAMSDLAMSDLGNAKNTNMARGGCKVGVIRMS